MEGCEVLTADQCNKIMKRYTKTDNFKINCFSAHPLKSQLDGMIGEQYFLKIDYQIEEGQENTAQFFLKTVEGANAIMFEISKNICAFEKEAFYYETLVPLLKEKELDFNITAKSYLCESYVIVLEDLSLLSYRGTTKSDPLDLEHCKACLETLAEFHVGPILYEKIKSEELGESYNLLEDYRDILEDKLFSQEDTYASRFMKCSVKGIFQLIELIPENGVSKNDFTAKLQDILNDIMASQQDSLGFVCTTLHGDLWSNNFLYRYENNSVNDCKLIDFQMVKYGPPALDVLQFILTNTRKSFRDEHQNELLTYYYNYLDGLMAKKGFSASDILDEDEFKRSCEVYMLPAKIQSIVDRAITFMSDENFLEASQTEEGFLKFLFEERGKYIVDSFKQNQHFRELMTEDVIELRGMLFDGW